MPPGLDGIKAEAYGETEGLWWIVRDPWEWVPDKRRSLEVLDSAFCGCCRRWEFYRQSARTCGASTWPLVGDRTTRVRAGSLGQIFLPGYRKRRRDRFRFFSIGPAV